MRIKQNLEEYIKKEEVEKIYDYQKKSFETKILLHRTVKR